MTLFSRFKERFSKLNSHIKNLSLYVLSPLIIAILNVFINPFMAANLSHADYALMGFYTSFNLLFTPFLSFSIISFYTRNFFKLEESKRDEAFNTILLSLIIIGFIGLLIVLTGFYIYHRFVNITFPYWPFAFLTVAQLFFANFINLTQVQHRMKREAKKFFYLSVGNAALSVIFAIVFVILLKGGAKAKLGSTLLASGLFGLMCLFFQIKRTKFNFELLKEALKFCWPITISAMLWFFLSGVDRSFLEKFNDNYNMGLYNIAIQVTGYLTIFYQALSQTFEPDLYKAIIERKFKRLLKIIGSIQFLNLLPILVFVFVAEPIIHLLTMGIYTDAAGYARILAIKCLTMAMFYSTNIIIIGSGYTKLELLNRIISSIFAFLLFKYLISNFGFYGAAWGQVVAFLFMACVNIAFIFYVLRKK